MHGASYTAISSAQSAEAFVQKEEALNEPLNDGPGEMPFLNAAEEAIFRRFSILRFGNVIAKDCLQKIKDGHENADAAIPTEVKNKNLHINFAYFGTFSMTIFSTSFFLTRQYPLNLLSGRYQLGGN